MKKLKQRGATCLIGMGYILGVGFMTGVAIVSLCSLATLVWVAAS